MRILATYNIKGGVGKTASACNLAYLAAAEGLPTLVWDLDPQGAASFYFRIKPRVRGGTKALLKHREALGDAVRGTDFENLDLIPADFSYRNLDLALADRKKPVRQLLKLLRPLAEEYEVLVLDCPPSISLVSENVFYAADALLVPLIPTTLSLRTWDQLVGHLDQARIGGLELLPFFSMVDRRKRMHREAMEALRAREPRLLEHAIPAASVVETMGVHRSPVGAFAPRSDAWAAYRGLWGEIRARLD
jgi:cellulose biosynthesis protein BcsQ